jgi:GNAT superfamily N-acetyltransferase
MNQAIEVHPLTPDRWNDLTILFGERGANSGCWCMWWRLSNKGFAQGNTANKAAFKQIVDEGRVPGLLAYLDGKPAGWISAAPRAEFARLDLSRNYKAIDDIPVWSIVCFYIDRFCRKQGVASELLRSAIAYAASKGAQVIEAYPRPTGPDRSSSSDLYTGTLDMFLSMGFEEVTRRAPNRPIVRLSLTRQTES